MSLFSFLLLVVVGLGAVLVDATYANYEVTATVNKPVNLDFEYKGKTNVRYYFTKDGRYFRADRRRVFQRLGRIHFSKVTEYDAGEYRMIVRGYRLQYSKTITLTGECSQQLILQSI